MACWKKIYNYEVIGVIGDVINEVIRLWELEKTKAIVDELKVRRLPIRRDKWNRCVETTPTSVSCIMSGCWTANTVRKENSLSEIFSSSHFWFAFGCERNRLLSALSKYINAFDLSGSDILLDSPGVRVHMHCHYHAVLIGVPLPRRPVSLVVFMYSRLSGHIHTDGTDPLFHGTDHGACRNLCHSYAFHGQSFTGGSVACQQSAFWSRSMNTFSPFSLFLPLFFSSSSTYVIQLELLNQIPKPNADGSDIAFCGPNVCQLKTDLNSIHFVEAASEKM